MLEELVAQGVDILDAQVSWGQKFFASAAVPALSRKDRGRCTEVYTFDCKL